MAGSFEDDLAQMHDDELSMPSIQVALEKHLALFGQTAAAERQRLVAAFREKRHDTDLSQQIQDLLQNGQV